MSVPARSDLAAPHPRWLEANPTAPSSPSGFKAISTAEDLLEFCKLWRSSRYAQERAAHEFLRGAIDDSWRAWLWANDVGLDPRGELFRVRSAVLAGHIVLGAEATTSIFHGPPVVGGGAFYTAFAALGRDEGLLDVTRHLGRGVLLREWVASSGVRHPNGLGSTERLIHRWEDQDLSRHPAIDSIDLDPAYLPWALSWAGRHEAEEMRRRRLAFSLVACAARIGGYQRGGFVRFRSEWLRGRAANTRAIPGASTYSATLTEILGQSLLEPARNYSTGGPAGEPKARTFRLIHPINAGSWNLDAFAHALGFYRAGAGRLTTKASTPPRGRS